MEITFPWLVSKLWVLLAGWFWYDKRTVDARLREVEKSASTNTTNNQLIEVKLDAIQAILEVKFDNLKEDMVEIKGKLK